MNGRSLDGFLSAIQPEIPTALLSGSGMERVSRCASKLPLAAAIYSFGFELRLDEAEPAADLAVAVFPGSSVAAHFRRLGEKGMADCPQAAVLARILAELESPNSFLAGAVGCPMLEYDLIDGGPDRPPGLFLPAADRGGYCNPGVMTAAVAMAAGLEEDANERRAVERIFTALPPPPPADVCSMPASFPAAIRVVCAW